MNQSEVEWYLRDHFFRQSSVSSGRDRFDVRSLPDEMTRLYLRFRNTQPDELSIKINDVVDRLVSLKVVQREESVVKVQGRLERLQCAKCFYICYLGNEEERQCLRCPSKELEEFPRKKK